MSICRLGLMNSRIILGFTTTPFEPAGLPVFGRYNEYGEIADDDGKTTDLDFSPMIAVIKGEVWDLLVASHEGGYKGAQEGPIDVALEMLGFTECGTTGDARYSRKFCYPGIDNVALASDGTWCRVIDNMSGIVSNTSMFTIEALVKWWHDATGVKLDTSAIDKVSRLLPYVMQQYKGLKWMSAIPPLEKDRDAKLSWDADVAIEDFARRTGCEMAIHAISPKGDRPAWIESNLSTIADLLQLQGNIAGLGLMLRPSRCGPQDGEYGNQMRFWEAVAGVARKECAQIEQEDLIL